MRSIFFQIVLVCLSFQALGQREGFVENGDCKTFYRTFGDGQPILIINGGPGMNSDGFVSLAKKLSTHNQTIIYDQRGVGKSQLNNKDLSSITMAQMIADMERLRKHLKIEKWAILGHSFGGMLASYYATLYPETITSLILSSSGGIDLDLTTYVGENLRSRLTNQERDSLDHWNNKISDGDTSFFARFQRGLALAPAYLYDRKNIPVIAERLTQSNLRINYIVWSDMRRINFDCSEKLKTFSAPVLIIQGKQDIILEKTAIKAKNVFRNSKLVILDKCAHYGWLDAPDLYFAEINDFLSHT